MPQWTVIVEIDPGLEDAAREAAMDVVCRLVKDADAELAPRPPVDPRTRGRS